MLWKDFEQKMVKISKSLFGKSKYEQNFVVQPFNLNLSDSYISNGLSHTNGNIPVIVYNFNPKTSNLTVNASLQTKSSRVSS